MRLRAVARYHGNGLRRRRTRVSAHGRASLGRVRPKGVNGDRIDKRVARVTLGRAGSWRHGPPTCLPAPLRPCRVSLPSRASDGPCPCAGRDGTVRVPPGAVVAALIRANSSTISARGWSPAMRATVAIRSVVGARVPVSRSETNPCARPISSATCVCVRPRSRMKSARWAPTSREKSEGVCTPSVSTTEDRA